MASLLRVPEVAAGATEVVLSEWLVRENTRFAAGQSIVVIETEKASVEVEAEQDAIILRALVPNGATVEVGAPIAIIGALTEQGADVGKLLVEFGIGDQVAEPAASAREVALAADRSSATGGSPQRVFISPLARKMLKEAGLTAAKVRGTGPNGRIVRRDVELAIEQVRQREAPQPETVAAEPAPSASAAAPGYRDIQPSKIRRAIAARLVHSKTTIPHFYLKRTARIDALLELRSRLNEVSPTKISVNDLILRAVAVAHRTVPDANVIWTDTAIRQFESVDIAVALASERGLVAPVVRGVQNMSPSAIASRVKTLVAQANDGTLRQVDLEGGSISVSNLGTYGVEEFSAIINPPHSAILAVGAGIRAPVVVADAIEIATQLTLVLSVDHRAIDGALAARWMDVLVTALGEPLRLLA